MSIIPPHTHTRPLSAGLRAETYANTRGEQGINEDVPDVALFSRKPVLLQAASSRSASGCVRTGRRSVTHRPEIKQAIIHILFGERSNK